MNHERDAVVADEPSPASVPARETLAPRWLQRWFEIVVCAGQQIAQSPEFGQGWQAVRLLLRLACLGLAFLFAARGQYELSQGRLNLQLVPFAKGLMPGLEGLYSSLLFSGYRWYLPAGLLLFFAVERFPRANHEPVPWASLVFGSVYAVGTTVLLSAWWHWPLPLAALVGLFGGILLLGTLRVEQESLSAWQQGAFFGARVLVIGFFTIGQLFRTNTEQLTQAIAAGVTLLLIALFLPPVVRSCGNPQGRTWNTVLRVVRQAELTFVFAATVALVVVSHAWVPALLGVVLLILAWVGWHGRVETFRQQCPLSTEIILLLAILAVATFFRFHKLDTVPPGCHYDEACNGLIAVDILNGIHTVYTPIGNGKTTFFFYGIAAMFKLFGTTVEAMRATAGLSGLLAIVMTWLLARYCFGPYVALGAALFLALSRWHITFSRIAWDAVQLSVFISGAFLFYLLAVHSRRWWVSWLCAVLAGVFLSGNLYSYMAGRVVPVLFVGFLALRYFLEPDFLRRHRVILPLLVFAFCVTSVPIYRYAKAYPEIYWMRMQQVQLFPPDARTEDKLALIQGNANRTLLQFDHLGDGNARHNIPHAPVLPPVFSLLFSMGLVYLLLTWRNVASQIVWLWFLAMIVPGMLSVEAPQALRTVGVTPALAMAAGVGIAGVWQLLTQALPLRWRSLGSDRGAVIFGLVVFLALFLSFSLKWSAVFSSPTWRNLVQITPGGEVPLLPPEAGQALRITIGTVRHVLTSIPAGVLDLFVAALVGALHYAFSPLLGRWLAPLGYDRISPWTTSLGLVFLVFVALVAWQVPFDQRLIFWRKVLFHPLVFTACLVLLAAAAGWIVGHIVLTLRKSGPTAAETEQLSDPAGVRGRAALFAGVVAGVVYGWCGFGSEHVPVLLRWLFAWSILAGVAGWGASLVFPRWVGGVVYGRALGIGLLCCLTLQLWPRLYHDYFVRYGAARDTWDAFAGNVRMMAEVLNREPVTTEVYTDSTGEAALRLLCPQVNFRGKADPVSYLPFKRLPQADVLFLISYPRERPDVEFWLRHCYPEATIEHHLSPAPLNELQFITGRVSREMVARHAGLRGHYVDYDEKGAVVNEATRTDRLLAQALAPGQRPFEPVDAVTWTGTLFSDLRQGLLQFKAISDGTCTVEINGRTIIDKPARVVEMEGEMTPVRGLQGIAVRCAGASRFDLLLRESGYGAYRPLPEELLHDRPLPEHGLLGTYWGGSRFEGIPLYVSIDPVVAHRWQVTPGQMNFSVRWTGQIRIDQPGTYRFFTIANDYSRLVVDRQELANSGNVPQDFRTLGGAVELSAGLHDLVVDYADFRGYSRMELLWQPPGQPQTLVPNEVLLQPHRQQLR